MMRKSSRFSYLGAAVLTLAALPLAAADQTAGEYVSFLACPVARDTGPDSDVCFVTEYRGERIALVNPPDWGAPQLHHRVLVEGLIHTDPGPCGAKRFEGRASVMPDIAPECGVILPYDGSFKGAAGGVFNSGSAAQRDYARQLAARVATDPAASLLPAILDAPQAPAPEPPFLAREQVITFPFGSLRGSGPDMAKLKELADYARLAKARHVSIVGYRATSHLDDGSTLTEDPDLARERAQKMAAIMARLGVDGRRIATRWEETAVGGTGQEDWRNRKVEIQVTP